MIALLLYVGSYLILTRWSLRILSDYDNGGFWYVPVTPVTMNDRPILRTAHRIAEAFYYPVWYVDFWYLDGPMPDPVDNIDTTVD